MNIKPILFGLSLLMSPGVAIAQDAHCQSGVLQTGMRNIEKFYQTAELELFVVQMMMREMNTSIPLQPDGVWGPDTARAFCLNLNTYIAIGSDLITSKSDAQFFGQWIIAATRASMNPSMFEYPD